MSKVICDVCGTTYPDTASVCPICGCDSFSEADYCPKCDEPKLKADILCRCCRKNLLKRFTDFADKLTAEEEDQLDEWLDGTSIKERSKFL